MTDIFKYLEERPYPGRGILMGHTPSGKFLSLYFIMGRSVNSRNRIFLRTDDGMRTKAHDDSLVTDPSLIIYHPVRRRGYGLIVTNGDQTDTICEMMDEGSSFIDALATREFEPDAPNYTPRISGIMRPNGEYMLSILKTPDGKRCERFYYSYAPRNGRGHFISTYDGYSGDPLTSFYGEPIAIELPEMSMADLAQGVWLSLNEDNRVALWADVDGEDKIINKHM